jgi:hypothetical protein
MGVESAVSPEQPTQPLVTLFRETASATTADDLRAAGYTHFAPTGLGVNPHASGRASLRIIDMGTFTTTLTQTPIPETPRDQSRVRFGITDLISTTLRQAQTIHLQDQQHRLPTVLAETTVSDDVQAFLLGNGDATDGGDREVLADLPNHITTLKKECKRLGVRPHTIQQLAFLATAMTEDLGLEWAIADNVGLTADVSGLQTIEEWESCLTILDYMQGKQPDAQLLAALTQHLIQGVRREKILQTDDPERIALLNRYGSVLGMRGHVTPNEGSSSPTDIRRSSGPNRATEGSIGAVHALMLDEMARVEEATQTILAIERQLSLAQEHLTRALQTHKIPSGSLALQGLRQALQNLVMCRQKAAGALLRYTDFIAET